VALRINPESVSIDDPGRINLSRAQIVEAFVAAVPSEGSSPSEAIGGLNLNPCGVA